MGSTHQTIYMPQVQSFATPIPPIPGQRAIIGFLDRETAKLDALIAKKQRLIELLQEKRTALISHAVTEGLDPGVLLKDSGIAWLGMIPAKWERVTFRHCVEIAEGQVDPKDDRVKASVLIAPNHIESVSRRLIPTETADEQGA